MNQKYSDIIFYGLVSVFIVGIVLTGYLLLAKASTGSVRIESTNKPSIAGVNSKVTDSSQTNSEVSDSSPTQSGAQVIQVSARGGYYPRYQEAKAGLVTVLKVQTQNTYDCSRALIIPDLNIEKLLPQSGTESINIPAQKAGTVITGMCSMGMYVFKIKFV